MTLSRRSQEPGLRYCKGLRRDGEPCNQTVGKGVDYCSFHDPEKGPVVVSKAGTEALKKVLGSDAPDPNFATKHTRRKFRERVAGHVLRGTLAEKLANVALRAADGAAQEEQASTPRTQSFGPPITVNVVVFKGQDGSHTVKLVGPASAPAVALPPPQSTEDDA